MPPLPPTTTTSTGEETTPNPTTALATTHSNTTAALPVADSSTSVIDWAKEEEIHSISSDDDNERSDLERAETKEVDIEACNGEVKGKGKGVLGNVLSHISTKSSWRDPGPPPDGGLNAWVQGLLLSFSSCPRIGKKPKIRAEGLTQKNSRPWPPSNP